MPISQTNLQNVQVKSLSRYLHRTQNYLIVGGSGFGILIHITLHKFKKFRLGQGKVLVYCLGFDEVVAK